MKISKRIEDRKKKINEWLEDRKERRQFKKKDDREVVEEVKDIVEQDPKKAERILTNFVDKPEIQGDAVQEVAPDLPPENVANAVNELPPEQTDQALSNPVIRTKIKEAKNSSPSLARNLPSIKDLLKRSNVIYKTVEGLTDQDLVSQLIDIKIDMNEDREKEENNQYTPEERENMKQFMERIIGKKIAYDYMRHGTALHIGEFMKVSSNTKLIPDYVQSEFRLLKREMTETPKKQKMIGKKEFLEADKRELSAKIAEIEEKIKQQEAENQLGQKKPMPEKDFDD